MLGAMRLFLAALVCLAALPVHAASDEAEPFTAADVDKSVDPCTDFYAYACTPWMKRHPIPPDLGHFGRGSQLAELTRNKLHGILDGLRADDAKRSAVEQKVGDYYAACMDETATAKTRRATLDALLARVDALKSLAELPPLLAELHLDGNGAGTPTAPLFNFSSNQDFDDAKLVVTAFDQGGLGLPERDYYLKTDAASKKTQEQYRAHLQRLLTLAGEPAAHAKTAVATTYALETALAKASMDIVARRDPRNLNHKLDDKQLAALMKSLDLSAYLRATGAPASHHHLVLVPEFFRALDKELAGRPLADWKTYLRVWLYNGFAAYLGGAFADEDFAFYRKALVGAKEIRPLWKRCMIAIDRDLGEALGQLYVAHYFPPEYKRASVALVRAVEDAFEAEIRELPWMGEHTKKEAVTKLHGILDKIGYPEKWRDYSTVKVVRDDWLADAISASRFEARRQLDKIGRPVDRLEWTMTAPTVDAYYDPQKNTINFPAGILQTPFFDPKLDDAANLGDIGGVIGHELTHGFDDEGRMFDATGNLRDWWTPADAKAFEERAQCTVDQYSGYTAVGDLKVNGKLTLGENTADLGGLRIAYRALVARAGKTPDPKLDGLTRAQRFFLSYAQGWCRNLSPEAVRLMVLTDPHSPPRYRVNGVLATMPEFGAAYQCKAGAPMVAAKQCRTW
jgi:endothelin-converting enzyme/putative endopeptidase